MVCAAPWKTCTCPWFSDQHFEDEDHPDDGSIYDESEVSGDSMQQNKRTVSARHERLAITIDEHDESDDGDVAGKHNDPKVTYPPSKPTLGRTATYVY